MHFFDVSIACYSASGEKGSFNAISYVVYETLSSKCLKIERFFLPLQKWEQSFEMDDALPVATSHRCVARISSFYFGAFLVFSGIFFLLFIHCCLFGENCRNANISPLFGENFRFYKWAFSFAVLDLFLEELHFAILFRIEKVATCYKYTLSVLVVCWNVKRWQWIDLIHLAVVFNK